MKKIPPKSLKWVKGAHLAAASCWVGGGVALILLYFLKNGVSDGGVLYGINQAIHHVDMMVVVIPGAFGCLVTGLIFSLFSNWGFFKQNWITVKWVVTVTAILFGTFFLGPWETAMMEISGELGLDALTDPDYLMNQKLNLVFGAVQVAILITTVFVSVFKPWKSKRKADA